MPRQYLDDNGDVIGTAATKSAQTVPLSHTAGPPQSYDTPLTPQEETSFQTWKKIYAPKDSGEDYDLRGAFKAGLKPDPKTKHWPDTFKKPNEPTFSNESIYYKFAPEKAGSWTGPKHDQFVPPDKSKITTGPTYLDDAGNPADQPSPQNKERTWVDSVTDFAKGFATNTNPLPALKGIYDQYEANLHEEGGMGGGGIAALKTAGQFAKGMTEAQLAQFKKGYAAYKAGDYSEAAGHAIAGALPLIGPAAAHAGEQLAEGRTAEGAGEAAGLLAPYAIRGAKALRGGKDIQIPITPALRLDKISQAANDFADANNIPLDVATRTENGAAAGAQNLLSKQPGSAGLVKNAREAQASALTDTAARLSDQINTTPQTAETAGASIRSSLENRAARYKANADKAYETLRQAEADPANTKNVQTGSRVQEQTAFNPQGQSVIQKVTIPVMEDVALPVDLSGVKKVLQPIFDKVKKSMPLAQQQASPGLKAIENILDAPDQVPASIADHNLSAVKGIVRGADAPYLRDVSQGLAAKALGELSDAVDSAVSQAGPDAVKALQRGRALTKAKWGVADLLGDLREEPVRLFDQITSRRDTAISTLREVAKQAPGQMKDVARGFVDGLVEDATREGGFDKATSTYNKWKALGPSTKTVLFNNPKLINDFDNLFRVAERISRNPNPSGTASTAASMITGGILLENPILGASYLIGTNALSRLLFNPNFARALTRGLKVSIGNKAAAGLAAASLAKLAGDDAQLTETPAMDSAKRAIGRAADQIRQPLDTLPETIEARKRARLTGRAVDGVR